MQRIRPSGPPGVARPYVSMLASSEAKEQMAQALDHIAVVLSAIDHNLEVLTHAVQAIGKKLK
jgi:hypothetical protein